MTLPARAPIKVDRPSPPVTLAAKQEANGERGSVSTQSQTQSQAAAGQQFSSRYMWYVVIVLMIASTLSFIDRQIMNLMIGPVKRDLGGLSDFQVSLIMGLAFAGFYNVISYPAGRWADSGNRRGIMAAGVAAWSVMTALCGMAHTYVMLFLA